MMGKAQCYTTRLKILYIGRLMIRGVFDDNSNTFLYSNSLTLLLSERPRLHANLAFLSAIGLR